MFMVSLLLDRGAFLWNISSMRLVTTKPPKIFTEAMGDRDKAEYVRRIERPRPQREDGADDDDAEIALVTDISGVCSAGVTRQTT